MPICTFLATVGTLTATAYVHLLSYSIRVVRSTVWCEAVTAEAAYVCGADGEAGDCQ